MSDIENVMRYFNINQVETRKILRENTHTRRKRLKEQYEENMKPLQQEEELGEKVLEEELDMLRGRLQCKLLVYVIIKQDG